MRRYSAAQARIHFSRLLYAAEAGDPVVIERRGVRFRLQSNRCSKSRVAARHSIVEYVDPAVLQGQWTWAWAGGGVRFAARRRR
jgi:hypothetical protein